MPTQFTKIALHGQMLSACPVCNSPAEMYERKEDSKGGELVLKAVMCSHVTKFGPLEDGCPMSLVPEEYYRPRYVEAAYIWNRVAAIGNARFRANITTREKE